MSAEVPSTSAPAAVPALTKPFSIRVHFDDQPPVKIANLSRMLSTPITAGVKQEEEKAPAPAAEAETKELKIVGGGEIHAIQVDEKAAAAAAASAAAAAAAVEATATATAGGDLPSSAVPPPPPHRDHRTQSQDSVVQALSDKAHLRSVARGAADHKLQALKHVIRYWGFFLTFPDPKMEQAFIRYFQLLRGQSVPLKGLILSCLYMIYALFTWRSYGDGRASSSALTAMRIAYLVITIGLFLLSFTKLYRRHLSFMYSVLSVISGVEIVIEGAVLRAIYSPFVVILLICYFVGWHALVFARYKFAFFTMGIVMLLYDIIALAAFTFGDETIDRSQVATWLSWYNVAMAFAILAVLKAVKRAETLTRCDFLSLVKHKRTAEKMKKLKEKFLRAEAAASGLNLNLDSMMRVDVPMSEDVTPLPSPRRGYHIPHEGSISVSDLQTPSPPLVISSTTGGYIVPPPESPLSRQGLPYDSKSPTLPSASLSHEPQGTTTTTTTTTAVEAHRVVAVAVAAAASGQAGGGREEASEHAAAAMTDPTQLRRTRRQSLLEAISELIELEEEEEEEAEAAEAAEAQAMYDDAFDDEEEEEEEAEAKVQDGGDKKQKEGEEKNEKKKKTKTNIRRQVTRQKTPRSRGGDQTLDPQGIRVLVEGEGKQSQTDGKAVGGSGVEEEPAETPSALRRVLMALKNKFNAARQASDEPLVEKLSRIISSSGATDMADYLRRAEEGRLPASDDFGRTKEYKLIAKSQLPAIFSPYTYVMSGYRCGFSYGMCCSSVFKLHNETMNIWTEFAPAIIFVGVMIQWLLDPLFQAANWQDKAAVTSGILIILIIRPIASGFAHTFYCVDNFSYVAWWSIDYSSICLAIMSASMTSGRFSFYCLSDQQVFFFIGVAGLFISTIISVLFISSHGVRAGSFILFVLFAGGIPFLYQIILKAQGGGNNQDVPWVYIMYWALCVGLLSLGMMFKTFNIPEVWCKGQFDYFFCSHQWWHICINLAHMFLYLAWREYLKWRQLPENACK